MLSAFILLLLLCISITTPKTDAFVSPFRLLRDGSSSCRSWSSHSRLRLKEPASEVQLPPTAVIDDAITKDDNTWKPMNQVNGFLLLNSVAVLWGTQHVVIKSALDSYPSPSVLNFWRFVSSTLVFTPALFNVLVRSTKSIISSFLYSLLYVVYYGSIILILSIYHYDTTQTDHKQSNWQSKSTNSSMKAGAELGLYTFLGFAFQAIGLETTTASRSAFLLYLNVKIVPFLAAVFLKRKIPLSTWISALLAFTGTCLLSTDGGPPNVGDIWCIAAAVASAMFILRLENFSINNDAAEINSVSFATGNHIKLS